jgi:uncharacterized coiled-coil protein SlyX
MSRQITSGFESSSIPALEERVRQLETRVALLTHAVRALTRKLEEKAQER